MRLISKMTKGWSQPNFWTLDRPFISSSWGPDEKLDLDFERYVRDIYQADGPVFACIAARMAVFSQARFLWRTFRDGRPSDLFGNADLGILERPWPNGATGDLLGWMEQDVSLAGNCYGTIIDDQDGRRVRRLRPDWTTIVTGSRTETNPSRVNQAHDARVIAYIYEPPAGNNRSTYDAPDFTSPAVFEPKDIFHYIETPDPLCNWRGMSWLTPIIREIQGDQAATLHKLRFFKNGATPSMAIRYDKGITTEAFQAFVKEFEKNQAGELNAYKALHLGGGADVTPLTMDFKQLDFKASQGTSETRIAAAAGVHPVIVGLSEGLEGSSLNAGNFAAARRIFVDGRIRSLWSKAAAALESILPVPAGCRLWYDDRDIPFLRADAAEESKNRQMDASAMRQLIDAGFRPEVVVDAVTSGDMRKLREGHSGLYSVQLQPAGARGGDSQDGGQE